MAFEAMKRSASHPSNALLSILTVSFESISTPTSLLQFLNASLPIVFMLSGNITHLSSDELLNAPSFIVVTVTVLPSPAVTLPSNSVIPSGADISITLFFCPSFFTT